jgi:hypothetical protein
MQTRPGLGKQHQLAEKPVLLDAVDATFRAVEHRIKLYRNLVVAVGIVSALSILSAILFRQWFALFGFIVLVPLTGGFLALDSHLFYRWRRGILEMARLRGLDLTMFQKTVSGFRHLPPNSLKAMLSALPDRCDEEREKTAVRQPDFVDRFEILERKNTRRILVGTGLFTLALTCMAGACFGTITLLLLGGILLVLSVAFVRR